MDKKIINILYAEDNPGDSTLVKLVAGDLSNELGVILNIKLITNKTDLEKEIENASNGDFDSIWVDRDLNRETSDYFVEKMISNGMKERLMSMSGEEDQSKLFNIDYFGKLDFIDLENHLRNVLEKLILEKHENRE